VVLAALELTAYTVRTSSIDVTTELAEGLPSILADADQLHQVLLNLIINAQQALQDSGLPRWLRVRTRRDAAGGCVLVSVADNGPGIAAELHSRIFEPYFTTKPLGVGTGVGLAVSAGIVEAHGGSLRVECPPEGGTVFTISLPFVPVASEAEVREASECRSERQRRVLVVDDEDDVREVLSEILASAGHRVDTAVSGRSALSQLQAARYDVILSDVRMPDMDGLGLLAEIRRQWPEQAKHVVFISGDTLSSGLGEQAAAGELRVLEKPFVPRDVRRLVAEVAAEGSHAT